MTPGEGQEDTRARVAGESDEPAMAEIVRAFSDPAARLLVTGWDQSRGERLAEVSHEALIRNWGTLRNWIAANREILRTRERIRGQMKHWEEQHGPFGVSPYRPGGCSRRAGTLYRKSTAT